MLVFAQTQDPQPTISTPAPSRSPLAPGPATLPARDARIDISTRHIIHFHPAYRFTALPTTVTTLEPVRETGLQDGLRYVCLNNARTSKRACFLLKL
jgi:hypothetical protein